jgi:cytochrome c biogenesis protein
MARCGRWLWRGVSSRRLAVILLAAVLLATVVASLVPQMPQDPSARETWLAAVALRYGPATGLLQALGLFDAYHAPWYLALLAALVLNTLACSLRRLLPLWKRLTRPPALIRSDAFYQRASQTAEWPVPAAPEALAAIRGVLARRRYRVWVAGDEPASRATLCAERGRWALAGTLASHVAAVLLVLAVAGRPALAWQESGLTLLPGQATPVGHGIDLAVRTGLLTVDRHPDGQPRDYRVPLAVLPPAAAERADAQAVVTHTVRINHPLTVRGVSFHLQSYGPAAQVTAPEGTFGLALPGAQTGEIRLPQAGLALRIAPQPEETHLFVEVISGDGRLLGSGRVADGDRVEAASVPLTFCVTRYTTWQVSRDPTLWLAVAAAGLLLVAAAVSLWVPRRRLWVRVEPQRAQMVGAGDFGGTFQALADELGRAAAAVGGSGEHTDG